MCMYEYICVPHSPIHLSVLLSFTFNSGRPKMFGILYCREYWSDPNVRYSLLPCTKCSVFVTALYVGPKNVQQSFLSGILVGNVAAVVNLVPNSDHRPKFIAVQIAEHLGRTKMDTNKDCSERTCRGSGM